MRRLGHLPPKNWVQGIGDVMALIIYTLFAVFDFNIRIGQSVGILRSQITTTYDIDSNQQILKKKNLKTKLVNKSENFLF